METQGITRKEKCVWNGNGRQDCNNNEMNWVFPVLDYYSPYENPQRYHHRCLMQSVLARPFQDLCSLLASLQQPILIGSVQFFENFYIRNLKKIQLSNTSKSKLNISKSISSQYREWKMYLGGCFQMNQILIKIKQLRHFLSKELKNMEKKKNIVSILSMSWNQYHLTWISLNKKYIIPCINNALRSFCYFLHEYLLI